MLKLFRQRKTAVRALLFAIVGIVGFMMVVTLVPSLGQVDRSLRDPQGTLARVGEASLTRPEVEREYQRRVRQLGVDSSQFRQLILQGLIRDLIAQRVAEYEAQQLGLKATQEEIRLQSRQFTVLYPGGKFVGQAAYQQVLQQNFGMNVHEFEQQLRRQTLLTKLFLWVTAGATVAPAEVEQEYRRRTEQVKIEFVVFRPETLATTLAPTEEELRTYYGHNRERYQVPERRAVRFVAIDNEELHRRIALRSEELERYHQSRRDDYRQPERVRARHILFLKPAETAGTDAAAAAKDNPVRKKAEQVLAQLLRGADFAALARKNSEHAESRDKGGDLGWVQRGQTVEALDHALFTFTPAAPP